MTPGRPPAGAMADGGRGCSGRRNKSARAGPGRALAEICRMLRAGGLPPFAGHGRSPDAPVPRWQDRLTVAQKTRACAVSCPAGSRPIAAPGGDACPVRQGLVHSAFVTVPIACYPAETSIGALAAIASSTRGFTTPQGAEPGQVIRAGPESSRKAQCGESAGSLDAAEAGSGPGQGARPRGPRPRTGCPLTHGHVPGGERTVDAWKAAQAIQTGTHSCRNEHMSIRHAGFAYKSASIILSRSRSTAKLDPLSAALPREMPQWHALLRSWRVAAKLAGSSLSKKGAE
jgi:hypothetical protein